MPEELKEIWVALTRLKDRIGSVEASANRASMVASDAIKNMYETLEEYHVRLFGEGATE